MKTDHLWFLNQIFSMKFKAIPWYVDAATHLLCGHICRIMLTMIIIITENHAVAWENLNIISPEQNQNSGPNKTQITGIKMSEMSAPFPSRICPEQQAASHLEGGGGWVEAAAGAGVGRVRGPLISVGFLSTGG
jgi:hypothetical protein